MVEKPASNRMAQERRCKEIMGYAVGSVSPGTPVDAVVRMMAAERVGIVAVCDESGGLLGVVTDRDVALRVCSTNRRAADVRVDSVMTADVITCGMDDSVSRAEELMNAHQKFRIIIVDDARRFVGIISLTDVLQFEAPIKAANIARNVTSRQFRMRPKSSPPQCYEPAPGTKSELPALAPRAL